MQPRLPQLCCLQRQRRLRLRRRLRVRLRVKLWLGPRLWLLSSTLTATSVSTSHSRSHLHWHFHLPSAFPHFHFPLWPPRSGLVNNRAHFICISNAWKVSQLVKFICEFCNMCPVGASWKLFTWNLADASPHPFAISHFHLPGPVFSSISIRNPPSQPPNLPCHNHFGFLG